MALPRRRPRDPEGRMSLGEHFRELRNRVIKSAIAVAIGTAIGWIIYEKNALFKGVYPLLTQPIDDYKLENPDRADEISLIFGSITSAFSLHLSVAIFTGIILASPVWLYQIWAFILPGLTRREKRISMTFVAAAVPLFLLGIVIAQISLPLVVGVLLDFTPVGAANFQNASEYLNFVTRFTLAFGFAFLLPVFLVALNFIGVLPASGMMKGWRVAVLLIFVFSAMMMPTPDPFAMMILAIPLTAFYFGAIGIARLLERRKRASRPAWLEVSDDQASAL